MRTGEIQILSVSRISDFGLYLKDDEGNEVLLPNRFTRLDMKEGDEVEVFVYHDSEDRLVASTEKPLIKVGEVAALKVVDKSIHGAFLDWGLEKDLLLPVLGDRQPGRRDVRLARLDSSDNGIKFHIVDLDIAIQFFCDEADDRRVNAVDLLPDQIFVRGELRIGRHDQLRAGRILTPAKQQRCQKHRKK